MGVALPILDCVRRCRDAPPPSWDPSFYDAIGRKDIGKTLKATSDLTIPDNWDNDNDGMNLDLKVCLHMFAVMSTHVQVLEMRFPHDLRVNEVRRLLRSSEPVRISLTQRPEVR